VTIVGRVLGRIVLIGSTSPGGFLNGGPSTISAPDSGTGLWASDEVDGIMPSLLEVYAKRWPQDTHYAQIAGGADKI